MITTDSSSNKMDQHYHASVQTKFFDPSLIEVEGTFRLGIMIVFMSYFV